MSGKPENKSSIELALKEVFYIHRNTVKEFQSEIGEWIEKCEQLDVENKSLNEKLKEKEKEKKVLEEKLNSKNDGGCVMCDHLKQSMKVVQDAYKQSLQEKDHIIQFLKEQLTKKSDYSVPLADVSNKPIHKEIQSQTPKKETTNNKSRTPSGSQKKKHSPDSTVNTANQKSDKNCKQLKFDQLDEDGEEQRKTSDKLRLARKNKRSRYKEDVSPSNKKVRIDGESSSEKESPENKNERNLQNKSSRIRPSPKKTELVKNNNGVKKIHVPSPKCNFAPETCFDRSASVSSLEDQNHDERKTAPMVVPETLGMDTYSSSENSESESEEEETLLHGTQKYVDTKVQDKTNETTKQLTSSGSETMSKSHSKTIQGKSKKIRKSSMLDTSRKYADDTTDILNSPDSETSEVDECTGLQPSVSVSETDVVDNIADDIDDSGYTSRLEKSHNASHGQGLQSKNTSKSKKRSCEDKRKVGRNTVKYASRKNEENSEETFMEYDAIESNNSKLHPLKIDIEKNKESKNSPEEVVSPISPVFAKPSTKSNSTKNDTFTELEDEPTSPLLLQSSKTSAEAPLRSLRNKNKQYSQKSSQKLDTSMKAKKKPSTKDLSMDLTDNTNLKQTTLSQVFTSSPKLVAPPSETDEERKLIQDAIKQSLLEFQNTSQEYKNKRNETQKSKAEDIFKKPQSPKMTTPKKRRPSGKRSPMASPDKHFSSPHKSNTSFDPDDTVAPSPNSLDSLPLIPLRRSPRKSSSKFSTANRRHNSNQSLQDMDETMAPSPSALNSMDKNESIDLDSDRPLNRSIAPDVHLTQYCEESENLDPFKASPDLKSKHSTKNNDEPRRTRRTLDMTTTQQTQSLPCSSKSYKFGTSRGRKSNIDTQDDDILEEEDTLKEDNEKEDDEINDNQKGDDQVDVHHVSFDSSFDRVPSKKGLDYAHVQVVKKQDERRKLKGHSCKECYEYYKLAGMSEEEIQSRIQDCSRHRAEYIPPDTPDHFWSIGFPDTQECHERGYAQVERNTKPSNYRRKRQLQKKFKSKEEKQEPRDGEQDGLFFN